MGRSRSRTKEAEGEWWLMTRGREWEWGADGRMERLGSERAKQSNFNIRDTLTRTKESPVHNDNNKQMQSDERNEVRVGREGRESKSQ